MSDFEQRNCDTIMRMAADEGLNGLSRQLFEAANAYEYSYHFKWLGRPIIQYPQDMVALQELIWEVKPRVIIETGVAHGGSLIFSASLLELLRGDGSVIGIDIEIRPHNRQSIQDHPLSNRITLLEGSSIDERIVTRVRALVEGRTPVLVILDSNHTHAHVLRELELYSPLVTNGSYLVVFDTVIEDMRPDAFPDRPWGKGNNPKTAVREFLKDNKRFVTAGDIPDKLLLTVAPGGYLKCIAD